MSDFSGRKVKYGIAKETTRGTAVNPSYWVRWETADMQDKGVTIFNQSAVGVLDKYSGAEVVETSGGGQIAGKITDQTFGLILLSAFSSYTHPAHSGETIVYDHTFAEDQSNTGQSLTITRVDPNVTNQFALAMLSQLEIDVKTGDFVRHVSQFISQPSASASVSPAFVAENEFKAKNVVIKMATTVGGLGAATAIPLNNFKLTVNKSVNPYFIVGQNTPGEIFANEIEVKGEFQLRYTDQTYKNLRFNNTLQACSVAITNTDVTIGSAANPALTFTMPACYLNDWKVEQSLAGIVTQTVTFEATYSLSAGYAIQTILTNTVSSY